MSEAKVVLVMNYVKVANLERVLFSKKYGREVSISIPFLFMFCNACIGLQLSIDQLLT